MYPKHILAVAPKVFKALAGIAVFLGVVSALVIFVGIGMPETPRWMGLITLVVGGLYCFFFTVAAETIELLIEIKAKIK